MNDRICAGCSKSVAPSLGSKPRKWCTETCRTRWNLKHLPGYGASSSAGALRRQRDNRIAKGDIAHPKVCPICKFDFIASHGSRKYCSSKCSRRAYNLARSNDGRAADLTARRRALEKGAKVSRGRRFEILERDSWVCHLCHLPTNPGAKYPQWDFPVVDHVVPLASGGEHAARNWATAHAFCNALKRDLSMTEFSDAYPDLLLRVQSHAI